MPQILKKLPNKTFLVEFSNETITSHLLIRQEDIDCSLDQLQRQKEKIIGQLDAQRERFEALKAQLQACKLKKEYLSKEETYGLGIRKVIWNSGLISRVPIASVMKPKSVRKSVKK